MQDVHGDPAFLNASGGDYHIGLASVMAGRGSEIGVAEDIDGDPRPAPEATNPDIGADEISQGRLYLPLIRK